MKKGGNFTRRDQLLDIQRKAQKIWKTEKRFERNEFSEKPKYMVTFPFPYMNGRLHLGHAYSFSKAEFTARFKQMCGYNALLPFGFHCTGMPISAASKRLIEEIKVHGVEKLNHWLDDPTDKEKPKKKTQWEILHMCGVSGEDIHKFVDPKFWCDYFPPRGMTDLVEYGAAVDFRRSMITTDLNPYYDSFIQWQFNKLKKGNFVRFGKRPSIYSPKDDQICAGHDRAVGEEVNPQNYTLIKIELIDDGKRELIEEITPADKVFLVAATLRPETVYGQTNCFVLPEGEYGLFKMKCGEIWICSDRSALNMAYQGLFPVKGQVDKIGIVKGMTLLGARLKAPMSTYETVYCLPMLSISMEKATGVVTSVPSDAPDDYAVLVDLKKKKKLREEFGLTDEMVLPFEPVEIIEIEGYSRLSAKKVYEDLKINSMNDKKKLLQAKEEVYQKGFYGGVMLVGDFKGLKVEEAKPLIKKELIKQGLAEQYYEPENLVVSRSGDECIVALCDQWYIPYGVEEQREKLREYITSDQFEGFNKTIVNMFVHTLDWLKEWGCSRNFGLGTKLPWDPQYVVESLSDSTIYMAFYTICHYLHSDINGMEMGSLQIPAEHLRDEEYDFIFLGLEEQLTGSKVPREKLETLRKSFQYWYPYDLRCSGKDLIKNHLTMSLYNHEFIFNTFAVDRETKNYLPKGYFCNGFINIDNKKMSKSEGNFYTVRELVDEYSADAVRLSLANGGDTVEDANFIMKDMTSAILRLTTLEKWMEDHFKVMHLMREESDEHTQFFDEVFKNEMNELVMESFQAYEKMLYRDVLKNVFYNFLSMKEEYLINCGNQGMRRDLFQQYLLNQLAMLNPITPHFCEIMFETYLAPLYENKTFPETAEGIPKNISEVPFPQRSPSDLDYSILKKYRFVQKVANSIRGSYDKLKLKKKHTNIRQVNVLVSSDYLDWQKTVMKYFSEANIEFNKKGKCSSPAWQKDFKQIFSGDKKPLMKKSMQYGNFILNNYKTVGESAFDITNTINEKELLESQRDFILRDSSGNFEFVIRKSDELEPAENKKLGKFLGSCVPMNPYIFFEFNK